MNEGRKEESKEGRKEGRKVREATDGKMSCTTS